MDGMEAIFLREWEKLVGIERGFVDDPSDSGGATRWGVTERVARRHGYTGDMRALPKRTAMKIAKEEYWDVMRLDDVSDIYSRVAGEMFECGYNAGPERAVTFLQVVLNAMNNRGRFYADISEDGKVGEQTLGALRVYKERRGLPEGEEVMYRALNCLQGAFLVDLTRRREKDEKFTFGWMLHRVMT